MKIWLENTILALNSCPPKEYGRLWCDKRIEFYHLFNKGRILSTKYGVQFFDQCLYLLSLDEKQEKKYFLNDKGIMTSKLEANLRNVLKENRRI